MLCCCYIALRCVALRCVALRCVLLCCVVVILRCVALRCVALRCVALRCVALRCVALRCVALRCVALRCVALRCVVLCCVVLCCVVLCCVELLSYTRPQNFASSLLRNGLLVGETGEEWATFFIFCSRGKGGPSMTINLSCNVSQLTWFESSCTKCKMLWYVL